LIYETLVTKVLVQVNKNNALCLKLPLTQTTTRTSQLVQVKLLWTGFQTQGGDAPNLDQVSGTCYLLGKK